MTDQQHPITPPPELVQQWVDIIYRQTEDDDQRDLYIATQSARWGSDQELEACIQYFHEYDPSWGEDSELIAGLRSTRRPKPPSLKEQALEALQSMRIDPVLIEGINVNADLRAKYKIILCALEQLDD